MVGAKIKKGAPYFFDLNLPVRVFDLEEVNVLKHKVEIRKSLFGSNVMVVESRYEIEVDKKYIEKNEKIRAELFGKFVGERKILFEEYTLILRTRENKGNIWLEKNKNVLANLIRSTLKPLDKVEVESVFRTMVRYSTKDLVTIDWDGGILVGDDDDFESEINLMKVANFQLLRYRMVDRELKNSLEEVKELLNEKHFWLPGKNNMLRKLINRRLEIITQLQTWSESLLLIGDWYTSTIYQGLYDELYLEDWKKIVNEKLETLGDIYESLSNNLAFSWDRIFNIIDVLGWGILLVGYFVLFFADAGWIK